MRNPPPQFTGVWLAGDNNFLVPGMLKDPRAGIDPQIGLAVLFVRTVAEETFIGQDRPHIALKINPIRNTVRSDP